MAYEIWGCQPAASVLGVSNISCDRCPFPFCVEAEAEILRYELREHMVRSMLKLGATMREIAKSMGVSLRSVQRYASSREEVYCEQCNLIHSQYVMCKSNTYSVVYENKVYSVISNRHGHASESAINSVECFIEYVFPDSPIEIHTGEHDYWPLRKIGLKEAENFEHMCEALNKYTVSLNGDTRCLQLMR